MDNKTDILISIKMTFLEYNDNRAQKVLLVLYTRNLQYHVRNLFHKDTIFIEIVIES